MNKYNRLLKSAIELLNEAKSQINKSETRAIEAIEKAIKAIEERLAVPSDNKELALFLLVLLDDVVKHLPSVSAFIRSLYSS